MASLQSLEPADDGEQGDRPGDPAPKNVHPNCVGSDHPDPEFEPVGRVARIEGLEVVFGVVDQEDLLSPSKRAASRRVR